MKDGDGGTADFARVVSSAVINTDPAPSCPGGRPGVIKGAYRHLLRRQRKSPDVADALWDLDPPPTLRRFSTHGVYPKGDEARKRKDVLSTTNLMVYFRIAAPPLFRSVLQVPRRTVSKPYWT